MGQEVAGRGVAAAQAVRRGDPAAEATGSACAERTINMLFIDVTLDVSRLSGWLNASAPCRVERKHRKRGTMRGREAGGRGAAAAAQAACREDPTVEAAGRARAERT